MSCGSRPKAELAGELKYTVFCQDGIQLGGSREAGASRTIPYSRAGTRFDSGLLHSARRRE